MMLARIDRYALSCLVIASSLWAAWALGTPPSNFSAFPASFSYVIAARFTEAQWAAFILLFALLHIVGIALRIRGRDPGAARLVGFIGLAGQTVFWLFWSGSAVIANPDTLFGFCAFLIGVGAAWRLMRYGWTPDV